MGTPRDAKQDPAAVAVQSDEAATQLVDGWVREQLCNSDFSGNSQAWNHFATARADLVQRITQALKGA